MSLELADVAIEFIYATLVWSRSRTLVASCPLTKHSCTIAFVFEHLWQYLVLWVVRFLTNYRILFVFSILHHWHSAPIFFVASNVGMSSMLACHNGSSRWCRNWRTCVCLSEAHTLACHLVDIWCVNIRLTIASQVAISHIVAENKEDIRLLHILLCPNQGR